MSGSTVPDPASFPPLPAHRPAQWARFGLDSTATFPTFVGLVVEDLRTDCCG